MVRRTVSFMTNSLIFIFVRRKHPNSATLNAPYHKGYIKSVIHETQSRVTWFLFLHQKKTTRHFEKDYFLHPLWFLSYSVYNENKNTSRDKIEKWIQQCYWSLLKRLNYICLCLFLFPYANEPFSLFFVYLF